MTGVASVSLDLMSVTETESANGAEVDTAPSGMVLPLEAIALSPIEYRRFLPETERTLLGGLRRGGAWLGPTSAAIRRLGPGGRLRLPDGGELIVTAVVPDEVIGAAEVISQATGRASAWSHRVKLPVHTRGTGSPSRLPSGRRSEDSRVFGGRARILPSVTAMRCSPKA